MRWVRCTILILDRNLTVHKLFKRLEIFNLGLSTDGWEFVAQKDLGPGSTLLTIRIPQPKAAILMPGGQPVKRDYGLNGQIEIRLPGAVKREKPSNSDVTIGSKRYAK